MTPFVDTLLKQAKSGDVEGARAELHALAADPASAADAQYTLGLIARHLGETETALGHFQMATKLAPGHANAHYYTGEMHEVLGDLTAANQAYSQALTLVPGHKAALQKLPNGPISAVSGLTPPAPELPPAQAPKSRFSVPMDEAGQAALVEAMGNIDRDKARDDYWRNKPLLDKIGTVLGVAVFVGALYFIVPNVISVFSAVGTQMRHNPDEVQSSLPDRNELEERLDREAEENRRELEERREEWEREAAERQEEWRRQQEERRAEADSDGGAPDWFQENRDQFYNSPGFRDFCDQWSAQERPANC